MSGKKSRKDLRKVGKEEGAMMAALQKKTSLSATEIKEQHQLFKTICPQGLVSNCASFDRQSLYFPDDKETISGQLYRAPWCRGVFHGRASVQVWPSTSIWQSQSWPMSSLLSSSCGAGCLTMTRVAQWTLGSLSLPQIAQASLTPRQKSGDSYLVILVLVVVLASLSELFGRHW